MPSPRRVRLVVLGAVGTCILFLFYSSSLTSPTDLEPKGLQDFYHKTIKAMDAGTRRAGQAVLNTETGSKAGHIPADRDGDGDVDKDDAHQAELMSQRLKAAEAQAKEKANAKAGPRPDPPSKVIGKGSSSEGQEQKPTKDKAPAGAKSGGDVGVGTGANKAEGQEPLQAPEDIKAEQTLNDILKKSPVTIFSKSYCPHSKRAKGLLLEKYNIDPDPYVVELDQRSDGPHIQDALKRRTGRRTVPNILVNGVSLGGADEVVALDKDDRLAGEMLKYGNKKLQVSERFVAGHA